MLQQKPKGDENWRKIPSLPMEEALGSFRPSSYITIGHKSDCRRLIKIKETMCVGKTEERGMRGMGQE